jgi:hypothetical protein
MESADAVEGHLPRTRTKYGLERLRSQFRFVSRHGLFQNIRVQCQGIGMLIHARESRMPSFGGLLPVTKDRRIQGRANEKRYRLLVQGL